MGHCGGGRACTGGAREGRGEGPLVLEVLGEADEDENFAGGVNDKNGGLVAGEIKGNDGIVLLGARVLGNQGGNVFRQDGDNRVLEDLDSGWARTHACARGVSGRGRWTSWFLHRIPKALRAGHQTTFGQPWTLLFVHEQQGPEY